MGKTVGNASLRGSSRVVRRPKRGRIISLRTEYTISSRRHAYNPKAVDAISNQLHAKYGPIQDPLRYVKAKQARRTGGTGQPIPQGLRPEVFQRVEKRTRVQFNGKEAISRTALNADKVAIGAAHVARRVDYAADRSASTFGEQTELDRAGAATGRQVQEQAQKGKRVVRGTAHGKNLSGRILGDKAKERKIDKEGKALFQADQRLGKAIGKADLSLKNSPMARKMFGARALTPGMSLHDNLTRGVNPARYLVQRQNILRAANAKNMLLARQGGQIRRKAVRKVVKNANPFQSTIKKITIGAYAILAAIVIPTMFLMLIACLLYLSYLSNMPSTPTVSFQQDTAVVASYLYDHKDEFWPQDENDMVHLSAVLAVISTQTSTDNEKLSIDHTYQTTALADTFNGKDKHVIGTGYQGLCGWSNEEIAAFIEKETAEGRYAGYETGTNVADLYTQCHYLREKLLEMKKNRRWQKADKPEEAALICYYHLILQDSHIPNKLLWKVFKNSTDGSVISTIRAATYQLRLEDYDVYATELASLDLDSYEGRYKLCYPTESSMSTDNRSKMVVPITLPKLIQYTETNEEGEEEIKTMEAHIDWKCHWLLASRTYESFYEAKEQGYLIADNSLGYLMDPNQPNSGYSLGLSLQINPTENTPNEEGELVATNQGDVVDEDFAKIFTDHGFYWPHETQEECPAWRFDYLTPPPVTEAANVE